MTLRLAAAAVVATAVGLAGAQKPSQGIAAVPVLDNASVSIARQTLAPGAREAVHTHPHALLLVVLSRGDLELHNGSSHRTGGRGPGEVEFVAAGVAHAAGNAGSAPVELLAVALKAGRSHPAVAPPPQPLPGVTRTQLLDNADVAVMRLDFEEGAREALHTHPYDLVIVPITPARLDLQLGMSKQVRGYAVGEAIFVPRTAPHAAANVGTAPFRLLGIAIK